ncbi:molybdopterin molybdotransferase MoeA [Tenacibaculum sp. M341]|uniref:molybdopterin molybdotransferase MoeA n=1 Tax=Tenacibaculum sp. M341 TaxID=2530339 RepID=UPI0010493EE9|nr:gephyrin-like molybdotransferase Glp [Tenacibaculum sp. M341]TCI85022.1 molybdopterin molybdenumtransferase MoeA [Tenacibaculum sp. M341]
MITIQEALSIVKDNSKPLLKETTKKVEKAGGYLLCQDVVSPIYMPPFRQSAMDGYALCVHDSVEYTLIGEVKAGDDIEPKLLPGQAVRIFTGAAVPDSAGVVIMQEKVTVKGEVILIEDTISDGKNIRPLGEQVQKGGLALKKGTKLTPAAIGYLISLGITEVLVYKKPSIAIVSTGNELVQAGQDLPKGKIYESNSKMLLSALYSLKFYDVEIHTIVDDYEQTKSKLSTIINSSDLVIVTGGVSVGDYDFVGKSLRELAVQELFYKVKQKPGKPLFYGKKGETHIFGLPGNPAAALSCFYLYVYMVLQKMMNRAVVELPRVKAKTTNAFIKRGDRPQFLKAIYKEGNITLLEGQSSAMLQTFALSNALVFVPLEVSNVNVNDELETILLPV